MIDQIVIWYDNILFKIYPKFWNQNLQKTCFFYEESGVINNNKSMQIIYRSVCVSRLFISSSTLGSQGIIAWYSRELNLEGQHPTGKMAGKGLLGWGPRKRFNPINTPYITWVFIVGISLYMGNPHWIFPYIHLIFLYIHLINPYLYIPLYTPYIVGISPLKGKPKNPQQFSLRLLT